MSRYKRLAAEVLRYAFSGGTTFVVEAGTFYVLHDLMHFSLYVANSGSYLFALAVNFLMLRYFVFRGGRDRAARQQFMLFAVLAFCNFFASNVLVGLYFDVFDVAIIAKCATIFTIAVWNFLIMRYLIFAQAKQK
jgi:putative flippase GtrA